MAIRPPRGDTDGDHTATLGHAGGGSTTLRTYTAFVLEADQRAATALAARRPRSGGAPS